MTQEPNTNTETALAVRKRDEALAANPALAAQFNALEVLKQKAQLLMESGLLPESIKKWQAAAAIMMRADELEVDYWTGLTHLYAVKGAPQPDGQLSLALVQRSGLMQVYQIVESTDEACTIRLKRVGQPVFDFTCTYTEYSQVSQAGGKQKRTHLRWYTIHAGLRALFSDVLNNMQRERGQRVIVETDLLTDVPDDDVYVNEEAEEGEEVAPTAPLSLSPTVEPAASSADDASDDDILRRLAELGAGETADIPPVGALDMTALYKRALSGRLVRNEWHFGNLLTLLMREGAITERMTADGVLDAMKTHKAQKEMLGELTVVSE